MAPEVSSTLLKMHRLYNESPPHETSLYDILGVKSNATVAEIKKAYRRKSRDYHPDKQNTKSNEKYDLELKKVRDAYEVLKDDCTRLPYHKFGFFDSGLTAILLAGGKMEDNGANMSPKQKELMELMGYSPYIQNEEQRIRFITTNLIETIRPLVEDLITQDALTHDIAMQCDLLKSLPLGSQIIRCIGRAYRHSGQAYLDKYSNVKPKNNQKDLGKLIKSTISTKWRKSKDYVDAALTTGRLLYIEGKEKRRQLEKRKQKENNLIQYHDDDDIHSDTDFMEPTDIHELERNKAQTALIHTLQIEALWKISKIHLDRTIQKSCQLLLSENHFFSIHPDYSHISDGWVSTSGMTIRNNVGRLRAAAALVLIGDIMVQCSKENTSWVD